MKQQKQRVIAIDYFRGICILMVVINHAWLFSMPFAYLTGAGGMWTSAAELFFLLSGITMMIVRGNTIRTNFQVTARKIWRRAGMIYLLNLLLVSLSTILVFLLPQNISNATIGPAPVAHGFALLWQMLTFQYSVGLASFLVYYSVFLVLAPFALYIMKTRCWPFVVISSSSLFILCASQIIPTNIYTAFAMWQFYFVLGLLIAKIRVPAISWFYSLPKAAAGRISALILVAAGTSVVISALLAFNLYPTVDRLTNSGWLPSKFRGAYFHLLHNQSSINLLLRDDRMGILRPLASLLILGAGYIIYQKYKQPILKWTGNFVNAMGRDTLWIFAAQAVIIPVMAALPIPRNQFIINSIMTLSLVYVMWLVTKRRVILVSFKRYSYQLYRSGITAVRYANSVFTGNEKEFQPSDDL